MRPASLVEVALLKRAEEQMGSTDVRTRVDRQPRAVCSCGARIYKVVSSTYWEKCSQCRPRRSRR